MMEELTPQILTVLMVLIVVTAPTLTLILSAPLLWRYRRAVMRAMAETGDFNVMGAEAQAMGSPQSTNPKVEDRTAVLHSKDLYRLAIRAPLLSATRYSVAWLVSAVIFAVAAHFVYPSGLGLPGFLIAVWIYFWPIVLVLPLILPSSLRLWIAWVVAYFVCYSLLALWASTIMNIAEVQFGEINVSSRSSVTPFTMTILWLQVNSVPTILTLLCFNRRVRAIAPLVLALVTITITGTLVVYLSIFSVRGVDAFVALAVSLDVHVYWLVAAAFVLSLAGFAVIGWALARWIARAYQRKTLSDRSLILDALWLIFACMYTLLLVLGGLAWIAIAPAAFFAYKLALAAGVKISGRRSNSSRGLTFLRVFALGRRGELLLDLVAKYWRDVGSVQMIMGPDVAGSTVQPHQFLDFLSGKLSRHFVRDRSTLERSMAERDRNPDPDGRFRINSLFCHADSWQPALPQLVQEGDTVLMDLRSFSKTNAGCIHELRFLAQEVPFSQCKLVVDDTTDESFLESTLKETCVRLPPGSPNYGRPLDDAMVHRLGSGTTSVRHLVRRLCDCG